MSRILERKPAFRFSIFADDFGLCSAMARCKITDDVFDDRMMGLAMCYGPECHSFNFAARQSN